MNRDKRARKKEKFQKKYAKAERIEQKARIKSQKITERAERKSRRIRETAGEKAGHAGTETESAVPQREVNKNDEIAWEKLDNTAHIFPVIAGGEMSNVYRLSVSLKEDVRGDLLRSALVMVLPRFPAFNCRMRRGVFWNYFEESTNIPPRVEEECTYPCQYIEERKNRQYLFRLSFYKKRINLEIFHAISDGYGGMIFLKEITYQYLRFAQRELAAPGEDHLNRLSSVSTEDSYLANFKEESCNHSYPSERAYPLKGMRYGTGKSGIIHAYMPVEDLKRAAGEYGATINEFITGAFIYAVYTEYLNGIPSKRPIVIGVPVNLRPYFLSQTTRNFFVMVSARFRPEKKDQSFAEVLSAVIESLREQTKPEYLESILTHNVSAERRMLLRLMPLIFKSMGLRWLYARSAGAYTATVSNLGTVDIEDEYAEYIDHFGVMLSRSKGQDLKVGIISFRGTLALCISSAMRDTRLQKSLIRQLSSCGIAVSIETNGVYYE